jgi:hypothetical protein
MEVAGLVVGGLALVVAVLAALFAKGERDAAREANRIAAAANQSAGAAIRTAQEANELTVGANETAADANRIAADALEHTRELVAIEVERRQVERAREAAELEAKSRAILVLDARGEYLVIVNDSDAVATDVVVDLVGPIGAGRVPMRFPTRVSAPEVRARRSVQSADSFSRGMGMAKDLEVELSWVDGAGEHRERRRVPVY